MSFRHIYMVTMILIAIALLYIVDPDSNIITDLPTGAATFRSLATIFAVLIYVGILHIGRRTLIDFVDMATLYEKAKEHPIGAGLFAIAVTIIYVSVALVSFAAMLKFQ